MDYFKYFPRTQYVFGNEAEDIGTGIVVSELIQDISLYVEVIDEIKRSKAFYLQYYIQENERPDNVSMKLYGTPSFHWTFFLMNDKLRESGWPLTFRQMDKQLKRDFPHIVAVTKDDLTGHFSPGQIVVGQTSGARGKVLRRRLDVGAIHIEVIGTTQFSSVERIVSKSVSALQTQAVDVATMLEYKSPHHYVQNAERVDIDPAVGPGALQLEVTIEDYYHQQNDDLKSINIIKPDSVREVAALYRKALGN
jgi:hypothetical protein